MTELQQGSDAVDVYGRADLPLLTAEQAADADRDAQQHTGIPARVLMENAARAAALILHRLFPRGRIVGIAGSGHNGGDLLVMARTLRGWGREVAVIAAGSSHPDPVLAHGAAVEIIDAAEDAARRMAESADVLIDGMLGTGARGAPAGRVAEWIDIMNATSVPIVALDLPSGVDSSTGRVPAAAINAAVTVMFGSPKLGLLLHPARQHCGRLISVDIGLPPAASAADAAAITPAWVQQRLRARDVTAHKSSVGRVLVLAGTSGMAGAAALSTEAALRAGAGLLRVASAAANREILQMLVPEATFLDRDHLEAENTEGMHALAAGPGMGTDPDARSALLRMLELTPKLPTLLDADALNMLAVESGSLRTVAAGRPLVITPHVRELSRITGSPVEEILDDPCGAARAAARELGCAVLLKGQPSIIADADGLLLVNTVGSSDAATAGMGDQLAGTIAAFLKGNTPRDAAAIGLFLSARAADLAALGRALTPRDVSAHIGRAAADPGLSESGLGLPFVTFDQPPRR